MAVEDLYATSSELKAVLGIGDTTDDSAVTRALTAASRMIDAHCRRFFYQSVGSVRFFTPASLDMVFTDDLVSVSEVAVDYSDSGTYGTVVADTLYTLWPFNAAETNDPYTAVQLRQRGARYFPAIRRSVRVTGTFGWPEVPAEVEQATILQAERIFKQSKEAPFGIAPLAQFDGAGIRLTARVDPTVEVLLRPLVKMEQG